MFLPFKCSKEKGSKMKAKTSLKSRVVAGISAVALVLGISPVAWAAPAASGNQVVAANNVYISKVLQAGAGTATNDTFTFTVTPLGFEGADGAVPGTGADMGKAANIADVTVTGAATSTGADQILTGQVMLPSSSDNIKAAYGHAGVFEYTVAEKALDGGMGATTGNAVKQSQAVYKMRVYIENGTSGVLSISQVTVERTTSDATDGATTVSEKVEPGKPTDGTANGFVFTNMYQATKPLDILKSVEGAYGDKTKNFTFAVTFTLPSYYTDGTYKYTKGDGSEGQVTTTNKTATVSDLTLADAQHLNFAALPVGTTYTVTETAADGYTPAVVSYQEDTRATQKTTQPTAKSADGTGAVAAGSGIKYSGTVDAQGSFDTVTNTYQTVSPTGVLINNLPYLLLVGMPVAIAGVWFAARRKEQED